MDFEIIIYEKENGEIPLENFLNSLSDKMKAKVLQNIDLLKDYGNGLREPYSAPIGDGIFELRIKQSTNLSRILYFFFLGKKIVLTNGFVKKSKKTPTSEITKAKVYREDWKRRNGE